MQPKIVDKVSLPDRSNAIWGAPFLLSLCIIPFGWAGFLAPLIWISLTALETSCGWKRVALFITCIIFMLVSGFNVIPGSERIQILDPYSDSSGNLIYASFSSGKAIIAISLLAFMLRQKQTLMRIDLAYLSLAIIIPVTVGLALYGLSIKFSFAIVVAAFINLLIVCISEEGFFRWLLQRGLEETFASWRWVSVPIVTVIFVLLHIGWSAEPAALILLSLASFCYSILWYLRRNFWLCLLTHWGVNVLHMLILPYPLPG
ncbi:CPBP family intramembrane glutamic endopeptidase [Microbulbifer variabilis]|uniref:CPBP family intramembrane glutamic endopeptidase n=1 Tax=Microbulbifer variabilis TaxID=266805 RepID=UPI001CFCE2BF|nr:CPBP family intramembrane glutamic endopeptidase [Microbulbifer variabilis]